MEQSRTKTLRFKVRSAARRSSQQCHFGVSEDGDLRADQLRQIAGSLDVRECDVIEMDARRRGDISLNVPLSVDTEGDEWQDRLVDTSPNPETLLLEASDREREKTALANALAALSPRETAASRCSRSSTRCAQRPIRCSCGRWSIAIRRSITGIMRMATISRSGRWSRTGTRARASCVRSTPARRRALGGPENPASS